MPPSGSAASSVSTPHSSAASDSTGGVPQAKRAMPGGRPVVGRELERRRMAHPARRAAARGRSRSMRSQVARMRPEEGRRARAAVEVLVAAADREVGVGAVQVDRHRAGRVRQVPHRQRAGGVRGARERGHVVHAAGAVVDVGEHQHGERRASSCAAISSGSTSSSVKPCCARQALGDVEVGREVAALGDDHAALRRRRRRLTSASAALSTL